MKILLIRFSSFGDVLQTLSVAGRLLADFPQAELHWVTRDEFVPLIASHPAVQRVWSLPKGAGFLHLWRLGQQLKAENFTHVYDAHNNLRSLFLSWQLSGCMGWRWWSGQTRFLRRSIYRWRRFLLFKFRINRFPKPFSGQAALLEPLACWGVSIAAPPVPQLFLQPSDAVRAQVPFPKFLALAPSAAFPLKRWPLAYWHELIQLLPDHKFIVLGGREDQFVEELANAYPDRVKSLTGQLSLKQSAEVIALAQGLISNDTGLMHVAEQIGKPCVALMGPAPFGFPSRPRTRILELDLSCRPCSKHGQGPCVNVEFQKCLRGISAQTVAQAVREVLDARMA